MDATGADVRAAIDRRQTIFAFAGEAYVPRVHMRIFLHELAGKKSSPMIGRQLQVGILIPKQHIR